jgi:hypothetical protein
MDCGGIKCEKCPTIEIKEEILLDGPRPEFYCDVPGATNYEKHEQGDTNYV